MKDKDWKKMGRKGRKGKSSIRLFLLDLVLLNVSR